jgi:isoleucyl-tRNA synthetase
VLLDTAVTEELLLEGYAREVVSRLQNLRKDSGFQVTDRVQISYNSQGDVARAITMFKDYITGETLGVSLDPVSTVSAQHQVATEVDGHALVLGLVKA